MFGFFFFSSLITSHSIFVTHHSSLKILKFLIPHPFGTYFQLLITQFFLLFVGLVPINWSDPSVKPTRRTLIPKHFLHFFTSSLLLTEIQTTPDQTQLKHKTFSLIHFIVFIIFFISKTTHGQIINLPLIVLIFHCTCAFVSQGLLKIFKQASFFGFPKSLGLSYSSAGLASLQEIVHCLFCGIFSFLGCL